MYDYRKTTKIENCFWFVTIALQLSVELSRVKIVHIVNTFQTWHSLLSKCVSITTFSEQKLVNDSVSCNMWVTNQNRQPFIEMSSTLINFITHMLQLTDNNFILTQLTLYPSNPDTPSYIVQRPLEITLNKFENKWRYETVVSLTFSLTFATMTTVQCYQQCYRDWLTQL